MLTLCLLQAVALQGGTVHTQVPGVEPRIATVLIEDGRITAVGEDLELPEDAVVLDAGGQHIVPGLIDGMVHHDPEHDALYTLAGVTLVRDMGNDLGRVFLAREARVRDGLPGPAMFVCGSVLDGVPPSTTESVVVGTAEEVDDKLPRLKGLGVDFIAYHLGIPAPAWERAVEAAHELELGIWGPVPRAVSFESLIASGQDGLVYLDGLLPPGTGWSTIHTDDLTPRVEALAASGMALMPLLSVYAAQLEDPGDVVPELGLLSPGYEAIWRAELEGRRRLLDERARAAGLHALSLQQAALVTLFESGVPLVPGSAAPNAWHMPGAGLHDELALWVAAGIPRADVLHAATRGAAEALGLAGERGSIAPGMVADLLCVDTDPRVDLDVLRDPRRVVVRGRVLERSELDALHAALLEARTLQRSAPNAPLAVEAPEQPAGELLLEGLLEAIALNQRVALERYSVVRLPEGGTSYAARLISLDSTGREMGESHIVQRIEEGALQDFELKIQRGDRTLVTRGVRIGGQMRIERRLNGVHVDTNAVSDKLALIDIGSGSAAVVLGAERRAGKLSTLYFEDAAPAISRCELVIEEDGKYLVRSGGGPWAALFGEKGSPVQVERLHGAGGIFYRPLEGSVVEGPGLELAAQGNGEK